MASDDVKRPELAEALDLEAHPEGYEGERASATAIYFLLAPGEESRWHRVRSRSPSART